MDTGKFPASETCLAAAVLHLHAFVHVVKDGRRAKSSGLHHTHAESVVGRWVYVEESRAKHVLELSRPTSASEVQRQLMIQDRPLRTLMVRRMVRRTHCVLGLVCLMVLMVHLMAHLIPAPGTLARTCTYGHHLLILDLWVAYGTVRGVCCCCKLALAGSSACCDTTCVHRIILGPR